MPRFAITFATSWEITWGGRRRTIKPSAVRRGGRDSPHSTPPIPSLALAIASTIGRIAIRAASSADSCAVRDSNCLARFRTSSTSPALRKAVTYLAAWSTKPSTGPGIMYSPSNGSVCLFEGRSHSNKLASTGFAGSCRDILSDRTKWGRFATFARNSFSRNRKRDHFSLPIALAYRPAETHLEFEW